MELSDVRTDDDGMECPSIALKWPRLASRKGRRDWQGFSAVSYLLAKGSFGNVPKASYGLESNEVN